MKKRMLSSYNSISEQNILTVVTFFLLLLLFLTVKALRVNCMSYSVLFCFVFVFSLFSIDVFLYITKCIFKCWYKISVLSLFEWHKTKTRCSCWILNVILIFWFFATDLKLTVLDYTSICQMRWMIFVYFNVFFLIFVKLWL